MNTINYLFSPKNPQQQYIDIQVEFVATEERHIIQLPAWRPGRYELGNFAKNVRNFSISKGNASISAEKIKKDAWKIQTEIGKKYTIVYQYYAAELNAGSTYFDWEQLYVNPVNCCVYIVGLEYLPCEIKLEVPADYQIACSLEKIEKHILKATNFDELADSPWIASASLKHDQYIVENTIFHLWFQGECKPNFEKIKHDFSRFTQEQFNRFGEFSFEEYHFLFHIVPIHAHHGVEHLKSTVVYLGSSVEIFDVNYSDFLGVSSHELYHSWNVKSIRPIEMYPYDFTKENYSKLGYLSEGVTTYMGDLMLLRSGVFSIEDFVLEMNVHLQKHFHNAARKNISVADSSFDTWLDGYVPGAPGRKVSIYTEGALLAFSLDVLILHHTEGKYRLDDVMRNLYLNFAKKGKGVSETDFWSEVQKFIGNKEDALWEAYYHGKEDFEPLLNRIFDMIGAKLSVIKPVNDAFAMIGAKVIDGSLGTVISSILPDSIADKSGLMLNDEIIAINSIISRNEAANWLNYFANESIELSVHRNGKMHTIQLIQDENAPCLNHYLMEISFVQTEQQEKCFKLWSK